MTQTTTKTTRTETRSCCGTKRLHRQEPTATADDAINSPIRAPKRAKTDDPNTAPPASVSVDMDDALKQERLEQEDGLGAHSNHHHHHHHSSSRTHQKRHHSDSSGSSSGSGHGNIQAAAAIMADCTATKFPQPLPPLDEDQVEEPPNEQASESSSLMLTSHPEHDDDSSLQPQVKPDELSFLGAPPDKTTNYRNKETHCPSIQKLLQNGNPPNHPLWILKTTDSVTPGTSISSSRLGGTVPRNSSTSSSSRSSSNSSSSQRKSGTPGRPAYRDPQHHRSTNSSSSSGGSSTSRNSPGGPSFGSNQRTQGSSLSERTNWSRYRNGTTSMGSSDDTYVSSKDGPVSSSMTTGSTPTTTTQTTTQTTVVTPDTIDDTMTALVSDWSLWHIKFHGHYNQNSSGSCGGESSRDPSSGSGRPAGRRTPEQVREARRTMLRTLQPQHS